MWNDLRIALTGTGDTVPAGLQFNNLNASDGSATGIDIELTSGFFRAFNGPAASAATPGALQGDRLFANGGNTATLTGLNPLATYDLYLINSADFATTYSVGGSSASATGAAYDGAWTEGVEFASLTGLTPTAGSITLTFVDGLAPVNSFAVISGIQIVETIPEPSAALLCATGLIAYGLRRRR